MKRTFLLILSLLCIAMHSMAQKPAKKPASNSGVPSQKEMMEMMKQMQQAMDGISPEDKRKLDSMGFKSPNLNKLQGTAAGLDLNSVPAGGGLVPQKDNEGIAFATAQKFDAATAVPYLKMVFNEVCTRLGPGLSSFGEVYESARAQGKDVDMGNVAMTFYLLGKQEMALYAISRAAMEDGKDGNLLNNCAAMLSMHGGERFSLPILNYLNKAYPGNSTIYNNLGQAWFGLGDVPKAEKYLDSCIKIYAYHPQANLTKSYIEEARGKKDAAIEAVRKSIADAYTTEKDIRLEKLGYPLQWDDMIWDRPMPADPLGLGKFRRPAYPMTLEQSKLLKPVWDEFIEQVEAELARLNVQRAKLEAEMAEGVQERAGMVIQMAGKPYDPNPPFAEMAMRKLAHLVDDKDGSALLRKKRANQALEDWVELKKLRDIRFDDELKAVLNSGCVAIDAVALKYMAELNDTLRGTVTFYEDVMRRRISDQLYYDQYTKWPDEFEVSKIHAKIEWLNIVKSGGPIFKFSSCDDKATDQRTTIRPLQNFDDLGCQYNSKINLGIGTIESNCSKLTVTLDAEMIKIKLVSKQGDRDDESYFDQWQTGTLELGIKRSVGVGAGPLRAEAKVGVAGFIEVGRNGMKDFNIGAKVSATAKLGTNFIKHQDGGGKPESSAYDGYVNAAARNGYDISMGPIKDPSVNAVGVEATMSLNGGFHVEGKGILGGMKR